VASAIPGPVRPPAPDAYTPRHLVERILGGRRALEGERKQVTVLFADVQGSLELLAGLDAEEARRLLDPLLELMMEAVHRYEGTVNQVMGDGIMALFGAPLAHEDHAARACFAALRMQAAVKRYAEGVRRREGVLVQMRVGLNSGDVVVRSIGSDLRMDYSAVGLTVHLAGRMEQLATPGSVLITASTLRLAEGYVDVRPLGPIQVRGLGGTVEVFELRGPGPVRSRFEMAVARGLTRFVGREVEMARLVRAVEGARSGRGQVVALAGDPGVGKSRLVLELVRSPAVQGWRVLETGAVPYGKATPYLPVVHLLRAYFELKERDDPAEVAAAVDRRLRDLDPPLSAAAAPLLALLDVAVDDEAWGALDPPQRRRATLAAIQQLLLRESRARPLLLVVEDLQWIDFETQAILDGLAVALAAASAVLLVTHRRDFRPEWAAGLVATRLEIAPLPPERADELLDALLGPDALLRPLKRLLVERAEGNPFFLEESVRALVETGVLAGERGGYRLAGALSAIRVPATVEAVLAARIDRLSAPAKDLLQSAAVIGRDVPVALLRALTGGDEDELRRGLADLEAAGFLYEAGPASDVAFSFTHALTHEVAYGALLGEQRRALHARIVEAIERLSPRPVGAEIDRLAHHAFRGSLWQKAVTYFRQAGVRAVARSASHEAVACFEQALAALEYLPDTRERREQAFELRVGFQGAFVPLGELERMLEHLRAAEALATALGDQRRLGRVFASMAHCFWWSGEPDRALASGQRALAVAASLGDVELEMVTSVRLGQTYFALGEYRRAADACRACLAALKGDLVREGFGLPALPAVVSLAFLGRSLALLGDFAAGIATTEEALRLAEGAGHPYSVVLGGWAVGDALLARGELARATEVLERCRLLCERASFPLMAPIVARTLGEAHALAGRAADGLALLREAVAGLDAVKFVPAIPSAYVGLAEGELRAGLRAEARRSAHQALALCRAHRQRGNEAYALRALGEIHAAADALAEAEAAFREARALADALGNQPLVARCDLGLGGVYRRAGDARAAAHLDAAVARLEALAMAPWLAEARALQDASPLERRT
jgi:class 3 adenylate cyclase/tetratricopeptide (TPR) repeat protein